MRPAPLTVPAVQLARVKCAPESVRQVGLRIGSAGGTLQLTAGSLIKGLKREATARESVNLLKKAGDGYRSIACLF